MYYSHSCHCIKLSILHHKKYFINAKNRAYHITKVLIFYADKRMVMDSSKNLCVFNFSILLKSQKFDARKIYNDTCFTVLLLAEA